MMADTPVIEKFLQAIRTPGTTCTQQLRARLIHRG